MWSVAKCTGLRRRRWWRWADFWQRCSLWCTTARQGWEELPGCHRKPVCNAVWCKKQEWRDSTDDTGLRFIANNSLCGARHEGRQMITKNVANLKSGLTEPGRCARNGRQMLAYLLWIDSTSLLSPVSFINLSGSQKVKLGWKLSSFDRRFRCGYGDGAQERIYTAGDIWI